VRHSVNWVRLQALHRAPPQQPTVGCEAGERETGTEELCEIKSAYTLLAQSLVKHPLKGDESAGLRIGAEPSEAPTEGNKASDRITSRSPM
jgi:hypothetical protein